MKKHTARMFCIPAILAFVFAAASALAETVELTRYQDEFSSARLEPARMNNNRGIAVIFEGTDDLHYYAKAQTAPGPGLELKIEAKSEDFGFGEAVFPKWSVFTDPLGKKVEVYAGRFSIFIPIEAVKAPTKITTIDRGDVEVRISGIACTSQVCLTPFEKTLRAEIDWAQADLWKQISFEPADSAKVGIKAVSYSAWFALPLALLAGLALNIMPCVWPVIPLIVMRIVEQAKQSKGRSIVMGLAFCCGILLFFACLTAANIILQVFYGTVLQWGDQFRNPALVGGMALLLVVLALFMFGVFTITVPSSISGKSPSGQGYPGAVGMGFLAAVLSTPCSFGILAAAFAWAQAQRLALGTLAIMAIGVGMAVPYAILTSVPGLLKRLPKAGRWMEIFKQAVGFVLLFIAIWLIAALPGGRRTDVLYFALVLSFSVWMWAGWVRYNTRTLHKVVIRIIAAGLIFFAGLTFLVKPVPSYPPIDWQPYNADLIETAKSEARAVLIKFTADWCLSCKLVDKTIYAGQEISRLIDRKKVLAIKADTTVKNYPATLALKNIYKEPGVPVSMLYLPGKAEAVRWRGKSFERELIGLLKTLPDKK